MTAKDGETSGIAAARIKIGERHLRYEIGTEWPTQETWWLVWPGHFEARRRDRKTQTRSLNHRLFSRPVDEEVAHLLFTLTAAKNFFLLLGEDKSHHLNKGQLGINSLNVNSDG